MIRSVEPTLAHWLRLLAGGIAGRVRARWTAAMGFGVLVAASSIAKGTDLCPELAGITASGRRG